MSAWSINRFTKPLQNFKAAAERLGIDLQTTPQAVVGPSVVREAALALNKLQQRIQELIRDRTQVLAAISHDLRTPITRMKIRTQFVADDEARLNFESDLAEMEQMINDTLTFAREDAATEQKKKIDLVSLVQTLCDDMQDMGHAVIFQTKLTRVPFSGRLLGLKRALNNLLGNAARYGKHVEVSLSTRGKSIVMHIMDDGPGIPEADLQRVFEPFYRAEQSRSRDTGGSGLGLAITRDIIKAHDGKIHLKNRKPHGLIATVIFSR